MSSIWTVAWPQVSRSFPFICFHFTARSTTSVNSRCKYPVSPPSLSFFSPLRLWSNLRHPLHRWLRFFLPACGTLELSDKCSGLNKRSHRSNVSSKFICQRRGQIKAVHFLSPYAKRRAATGESSDCASALRCSSICYPYKYAHL